MMKTIRTIVGSFVRTAQKRLPSIKRYLFTHKPWVAGAIGLILVGAFYLSLGSSAPEGETRVREVQVARVADIMNGGGGGLATVAEIRSVSEAKISAETGGRVSRVYSSLGDVVSAGRVLAELENASQRAAVLQAEGVLDAAKAAAPNADTSLESARGSAVTTLLGAYAAIDSAIEDAVGRIMTNPELSEGSFSVSSRDTAAIASINAARPRMQEIIKREEVITSSLSSASDLAGELVATESELREVRAYLDTTLKALNAAVPREDVTAATITGYVSAVTTARSGITSSLAAIVSARSTLETAIQNTKGGNGTVSGAQASIKQAEGAYHAALANLEKTIIRSPISGTLNNFTIKLGDFVAATQQVAVVSNNGALEGVAYVSEEDRARIAAGDEVSLEGGVTGRITKIAPALDPVTRRIEVRIGLPGSATKSLTNGQSVRVELVPSAEPAKSAQISGPVAVPITALKMEADRTVVFGVSSDGRLVAHVIQIGKLSGDSVQVMSGITSDTEIVTDARGLREGDQVTVAAGADF